MRIVGGHLRGRRLAAPADQTTRPTTDRVREALFNIIESRYRDRLAGGRVGDLFAGTGALGLEAMSRGAAHATFIEQGPAAMRVLADNIAALDLTAETTLIRADIRTGLARLAPCDILFLDPPYGGEAASDALTRIATYRCIRPDGIIVLESGKTDNVAIHETFFIDFSRRYGGIQISVLKTAAPADDR